MTTSPGAPPPEPPPREASRMMVRTFVGAAIATVVVAIVLGILVEPWLFAIALFAIADLGLARAYATGRLTVAPDAAAADPSYNPYARED